VAGLACGRVVNVRSTVWGRNGDRLVFTHDKTNLDIFWLRDESLEDVDNVPDPDILAREIVEDAALAWLECLGYAIKRGSEITPRGDILTPTLS
jgi:hypothetical protein